jgi:hypothetical protein
MSDTTKFSKLVDDIWEMVFGTSRNTKSSTSDWVEPDNHDFSYPVTDYAKEMYKNMMTKEKPKRARGLKGRYKGDDLSTAYTNEAWVGGKAPKKKRGKKNVKK